MVLRERWMRTAGVFLLVLACGLQSGCRAEAPWPLWEAYTQRFLDQQGRIIDHSRDDLTTSEGQAYGMFFALVAGDRPRFEKILAWTEANLAQGDLTAHLPAWKWGKAEDGSWRTLDVHSASDADLWMAYDLAEAGRLWKVPRYEKLGSLMAASIARQEVVAVPSVGSVLMPGSEGFRPDAQSWVVNPSYVPTPLLVYFARGAQAPWRDVLATTPAVIRTQGGFAMDWMLAAPGGLRPQTDPAKVPATEPAVGSYDAIRVYLWAGMADPKADGTREVLAAAGGMGVYLKAHAVPPVAVDAKGTVLKADGPVGFSAAVIPYLHALGMKTEEKAQTDRLIALKDEKTGLYGKDQAYYDQCLALFSTGWTEQRFRFDREGQLHVKWK